MSIGFLPLVFLLMQCSITEMFSPPRMLRDSTFDVADGHLRNHLGPDWNDIPVEHIDIDAVNEWIWKKRQAGLPWVTIKNILRTMQRVLSCSSKDKKPPFSQEGLAIPERDKLQMKIGKAVKPYRSRGRKRNASQRRCTSWMWMKRERDGMRRFSFLLLRWDCVAGSCSPCESMTLTSRRERFVWMNQPINGRTKLDHAKMQQPIGRFFSRMRRAGKRCQL